MLLLTRGCLMITLKGLCRLVWHTHSLTHSCCAFSDIYMFSSFRYCPFFVCHIGCSPIKEIPDIVSTVTGGHMPILQPPPLIPHIVAPLILICRMCDGDGRWEQGVRVIRGFCTRQQCVAVKSDMIGPAHMLLASMLSVFFLFECDRAVRRDL